MRDLFLKLGGVYIKAGQFISNLSHALPECLILPLQELQDRVLPHSFEEMDYRFQSEFGQSMNAVFEHIDETPAASASTAQVHTGNIGGVKVAVKILYPGIEELIQKDLKTLFFVMKRINRYIVSFDFRSIHSEIQDIILREMDLKKEAESLQKMKNLFRREKDYIFPEVYIDYSKRTVLVTRFIEGVKISEAKNPESNGEDRSRPLQLLVRAYILMIFKYRYFHADPHSGNLIYTPEGKLCFIDFGATGEISEFTRATLRKIIICIMSRDYYGVIEGMEELGFFSKEIDKEKLEEKAKNAFEKFQIFLKDTDYFRNLAVRHFNAEQGTQIIEDVHSALSELLSGATIPKNLVILQRILALLVGNIAMIDPYHTLIDYAERPFRLTVLGGSSVERILKEEGKDLFGDALSIPGDMHKALLSLNRGKLNIRSRELEAKTEKIYILGHQMIYTAFIIAGVHFGNAYVENGMGSGSVVFYTMAGFFSVVLLGSFFKNRKKD